MTPARFQTIEEIFLAALDKEPDHVSAFLDTACEGDVVLQREVEALLASDQRAGRFIETSSVGLATKVIQNQQADSLVGRTIGHYEISESIGAGGMGEVYLAIDMTAGRKAALKLLPMRFTGDADRLKRFQQEAHAVVALNHPNILTVYEIGEDHSTHYIASELIEGETLRQRLARGRIEVGEAVDFAIQVVSALAAAHDTGIVHRDIKPENIMLRPDGYVKVLDFGIAKLAEQEVPVTMPRDKALLLVETNLGSILGTVRYMSPEQACGAQVDATTDIWSLGVVLYEMVTGHTLFTGDTPGEVMSAILEKEPPPLTRYIKHTPTELQQIIDKTLRKDRKERYPSAHKLLQALKDLRRKLEAELERAAAPLWLRWARSPAALVLVLTITALALALPFYLHRNLATSLPPDKGIAVLPFENLSDEKEHAAFADGVQDDILTKLAKIADLKVISQTSVMDYRGKRNLRQIGNDLGVSHVLEGSVRRAGTHLRLNAQLIDTRTDTHVWAQQYDRDLNDLFAVQSDIAQKVAERLNANVTSAERLAIEEKPTTDPAAFELYSRAGELLGADASKAIDLLNQAVARDPSFLKAYCLLVVAHDALYAFFDHTPARLASAEAALREAFRIRPNAGETHWARAYHLYNGYRDYDGALAELEVARRSLPNDPYVFKLMGSIQRRQGRWEESTRNLERAIELNPRDARILTQTGFSYGMFRRYAEQKSKLDRALTVAPNDVGIKADRAFMEVDWKADTGPLHQVIDDIRATNPTAVPQVADRWLLCALAERDVTAAKDALLASEFPLGDESVQFPRPFVEGVIARMANDEHKAQLAFTAARENQEKTVNAQPDYAPAWCVLGVIDAALGRKEDALREGRRAIELLPVEKDSIDGLVMIKYLAMSAAWVGDKDLACEQLASVIRRPSNLSYGQLKLLPWWDPLRGDTRFEKILEESRQPIALEMVEKSAPQKSIAVLPFENLNKDEENASFAGGVQDEILTDLAKVADLKVISRTSVMKYKSDSERNLREIANTLGVSYVVEGSVQRAGERVRVSAQLIDARNDTHLWAEHYDRDFADIFALQNEIAQQIAEQLKANLSPAEKAAIAERPTADPVAYAYYTKAKEIDIYSNWEDAENEKAAKQKVELLEKATQRDPNFALAYCALAKAQLDQGDKLENFELAKKAAETALRLRPDLAEGHLALARYYWIAPDSIIGGDREAAYDRARDELAIVRRMLPNNAEALLIDAVIGRRQNRWDASLANLQKASELDPSNGEVAFRLEQIYFEMRRYSELEQFIKKQAASGGPRVGAIGKSFYWLPMMKLAQGDPVAAQSLLEQVPREYDPYGWIWDIRIKTLLYLRDYDAANRVIAATPAEFADRNWAYGQIARTRGDKQKALAAFAAARQKMDAQQGDKPKDADYFAGVAKLDAGLGRKEEAIREARQAVELSPIAKDSLNAPVLVANLALVYAWTGEQDLALEQLEKVATLPGSWHDVVTYGDLLLNPCWDSLRGDKRFDKIVAAAKAASRYALTPLSEKSIAVLPLENLSEDKENAFFATGIQDELLSDLSKIKDLKVISRTSVMQYKSGTERNLKEIAQQLGVNNVVEGSVSRAGNKVRVSVQLIDARNDTHLWAEHYDRDVADVFAIQTEVAQQIADQLQAKLSPAEKAAIAERPTADPVAYALYTEAKAIGDQYDWEGEEKPLNREVELLEKATQRDPNFALAYCALAKTQVDLSSATEDPEDRKHLELAKKAAEAASRVRPDLGEAHLELARYYYYANLHTSNFDRARDELVIARRTLPNNSEAIMIGARIDKRQNRWDASLANFQKASELDPRNGEVGWRLGQTYFQLRRYSEFEQLITKDAASSMLQGPWIQLLLAEIKLAQGDPVAAQSLLEQVPLDFSPSEQIWGTRFMAALYLRDYDAANRVIAATPAKFVDRALGGQPPEIGADGQVALLRGDKEKALAVFAGARKKLDATWSDKPKDEEYFRRAGMLDAGLGRKEDAIREARHAVDLMPIAKDSQWGPLQVADLALVYAWTGERDRALEQLEIVATIRGDAPTTYGDLRFNPCWDSLRGDPRFDKIVAEAKAASR